MKLHPVEWPEALSIWWSMIWRTVLAGFLVAFLVGYFVALAARDFGRPDLAEALGATFGWLASLPAGIWGIKEALAKKHNGKSVFLTNVSPDTHVRCPECSGLVPRESRRCMYCACKLVPQ